MEKELLQKYIENGLSSHSIAKQIGCSQTRVAYWIRKYKLSTKYGRKLHCCVDCGETDSKRFYGHAKNRCQRCHNKLVVKRQKINRREILKILGNKCCKCGFSDLRALHIDHVNGGGREEARVIGRDKVLTYVYNKIKKGSKDYQLLCANCNCIKIEENHEIKHKYPR